MKALLFDPRLLLASPLFEVTSFLLGLAVGSFANVCIHRLPLGLSVVAPPSRCPSCRALIAPYDNVPVLAWIWLRGRCRGCRAPISMRYPVVELLTGLLFLALAGQHGPSLPALRGMALAAALVILGLIDLDHQLLPDAVTLPFLALGLALGAATLDADAPVRWLAVTGGLALMAAVAMALGWDRRRSEGACGPDRTMVLMLLVFSGWQRLVTGTPSWPALVATGGYLLMAGIAYAAKRYYGEEALGEGDWKMVAMLGALLPDARHTMLAVFLGTLAGALAGLALIAFGRGTRRMKIPLGSFLSLGGLAALVAGDRLLAWYARYGGLVGG